MTVFGFEEIGEDFPRPPFAALRALQAVGVLVTPKGWQHIDVASRKTLSDEGGRERVDILVVRSIVNTIPANQIKLVSRAVDPSKTEVPVELLKALGPQRSIPSEEWGRLENIERFVLASLAYNTRLLWKAIDEMERRGKLSRRRGAWTGMVARCEIRMRPEVLIQVLGADFLDGRALVLARGAGRRAARSANQTFDLQAETEAGPIELDWGVLDEPGAMLWQAHVSGWDGAFLPAASLQAAVTAAIAIFDMVKELDPKVSITLASLNEEPWLVGNDGPADIATRLFSKPGKSASPGQGPAKAAEPAGRVGGGTVKLDASLVPGVASPLAAQPAQPAPAPAKPPETRAPAPPAASPSKPVQKMATAPNMALDEPVDLAQFKSSNRPLVIAAVVVALLGAGLLGYTMGR